MLHCLYKNRIKRIRQRVDMRMADHIRRKEPQHVVTCRCRDKPSDSSFFCISFAGSESDNLMPSIVRGRALQ